MYCTSILPKAFYDERQKMFALHLVLVTLHMQFTISVEQDK